MPAFSLEKGLGREFLEWLKTPCGGDKAHKDAVQIGRRGMKYLMACLGETSTEINVSEEYMDCCLGSPDMVINFLKVLIEELEISSSGALSYMKSLSDMMDFRKSSGITDDTLRSFATTEVYIRRGKENLSKRKKLEYARNLDLESLMSRKSWATLEEMQDVIPYHTPQFEHVVQRCIDKEVTLSELAFTTRYITCFLFLRVKACRPMTFQFLTIDMLDCAKENGGFVDQSKFKTSDKYMFDSLVLTEDVLSILDVYVREVRPQMKPQCDYVLVNTAGNQFTALGASMSLLVHDAIGKFVNPTRYRQIVETESSTKLSREDGEVITRDQKHSSQVRKFFFYVKHTVLSDFVYLVLLILFTYYEV